MMYSQDRDIAMVFQNYALIHTWQSMTTWRLDWNCASTARKIDKRVQAAEIAGFERISRPPNRTSGGQRQQVV